MNRQQFTGWLSHLLDALPWRRARRPARRQAQARILSRPNADRLAAPDAEAIRRQKAETAPTCSTLPDDPPPSRHEASAPSSPSLSPAPALPSRLTPAAASPPAPPGDEQALVSVDPERRLAFARFLVQRGVFNEGFPSGAVPRHYQPPE